MEKNSTPELDLQAIFDDMQGVVNNEEDGRYQLGVDYNLLAGGKYAAHLGFHTTAELLRAKLPQFPYKHSALARFGAVASAFTKQIEQHYKMSKLARLVTLAAVANIDLPADPGPVPIQVSSSQTKQFSDCTEADLESALRVAHGGTTHQPTPPPEPIPSPTELPRGVEASIKALNDGIQAAWNGAIPTYVQGRTLESNIVLDAISVPIKGWNKILQDLANNRDPNLGLQPIAEPTNL